MFGHTSSSNPVQRVVGDLYILSAPVSAMDNDSVQHVAGYFAMWNIDKVMDNLLNYYNIPSCSMSLPRHYNLPSSTNALPRHRDVLNISMPPVVNAALLT